jgi:oxygen-independent coproporphyrinogen-3 oxidase
LTIPQLKQIFDALFIYNKVEKGAEVTIEVNPDDVTAEFADAIQQLPVNRISMGAQTFDDARLRFLHRRHNAVQVHEAVSLLRSAGIRNISIDLMYGFPGESLADWEHDIASALALEVEHLSAYCLTVEEGTELWRMQETLPDEETERAMYELLIDKLEAAGFEHYEISNFAKPGFRSRHNSSYWTGVPYIGIGAAAHSYDGQTRSWNIADIHQYIEGIEKGIRVFESETLDTDTRYNDMVTVALRTREGLDLTRLSEDYRDYCLKNAQRFLDDGLLRLSAEHLSFSRKGLFVSDMVMSELMKV